MNTHADKTQENKSQLAANKLPQRQSGGESAFQFVDNRPESAAQRKLQEMVSNSPQVRQLKAIQKIAKNVPKGGESAQLQTMGDHDTTSLQPHSQKKVINTGLPDNLKSGIENLSGYSMDDVQVHYNSDKPAQLQAYAYAQGTDIHVGPGQEKHLPHEARHVVQQKQGRVQPIMQMKGNVNVNDDAGLEREADIMGEKAVQLFSTSFSANELTEPIKSHNGRTAQLLTIQRAATEKPAKLHIHADLDAPGMALIDQLKSGEVGHAWISLEWKDPGSVPDGLHDAHKSFLRRGGVMADPMGFWPKMFTDYDPLTDEWQDLPDDQRASYSSNPFKSYVPGQMVHPDNIHSPKATQTYDITQDQASAVINYAESKRGAQYSVFYYNCTTFAKEAAKVGGQSPPSMGTLGICYPDALYKSILKNQKKRKGTTTVITDAGTTTVEGDQSKKKG